MVHVLGVQPDGDRLDDLRHRAARATRVFADAPLPFDPVSVVMDLEPGATRPTTASRSWRSTPAARSRASRSASTRSRGGCRASSPGPLMAALLYLLARILFRRREVAVLVGIFVLVDGMLFVQRRIGMNDVYVGLGILAAYTLFAALWTGYWRWRGAFWVAMPLIGLCLGFALASKWVALYAIGGLGILVLVRSALGRLLIILGLIAMTGVLGYMALAVPAGGGLGNLPFVVIMIALTAAAVVINVHHPIAWSDDEMRFAVGAPAALGLLVVPRAPIATGTRERARSSSAASPSRRSTGRRC